MLTGVSSFVWQDPPGRDAPGVSAWLVKAANGNSHTAPGGFDFRANARGWLSAKGVNFVHGWTWLYDTTDGTTAADELVDSLPHAPSYGMDVEGDDSHNDVAVQPATDRDRLEPVVRAFAKRIRQRRPDADLWFTSYPDRAQAMAHGAPWDALVEVSDYGLPQVYFASQGSRWQQIVADHKGKPVVAAFSPGNWSGWVSLAQAASRQFGAIALWRYPDTKQLADQIAALAATQEDDVTKDDVLAVLASKDGRQAIFDAVWRGGELPIAAGQRADEWQPATFLKNIRMHAAAADAAADPAKLVAAMQAAGLGANVTANELQAALVAALKQLAADDTATV